MYSQTHRGSQVAHRSKFCRKNKPCLCPVTANDQLNGFCTHQPQKILGVIPHNLSTIFKQLHRVFNLLYTSIGFLKPPPPPPTQPSQKVSENFQNCRIWPNFALGWKIELLGCKDARYGFLKEIICIFRKSKTKNTFPPRDNFPTPYVH